MAVWGIIGNNAREYDLRFLGIIRHSGKWTEPGAVGQQWEVTPVNKACGLWGTIGGNNDKERNLEWLGDFRKGV